MELKTNIIGPDSTKLKERSHETDQTKRMLSSGFACQRRDAAGSCRSPNVDANIDIAMNFYRTQLAESFQTGDLAADVWELLCLVQSGKDAEPEYQFMKNEGPALTDKSTPTDYAKKILAYILLEKDVTQLAGELAAMQNENGDFVRGEVVSATNTAFSVLALLAARAQDVEVSFDCDKAVAADYRTG